MSPRILHTPLVVKTIAQYHVVAHSKNRQSLRVRVVGILNSTSSFKLKVIELAEATSNRNAGKELGINEKLVWDLDEVHWP